ncbi:MAG: hypothetical protein ACRC62_23825 [Microcoleus sp.]
MEKLAEFKQPCADLFLHLGPEWQTDIPTTEDGEGAIAYWGTISNSGNEDDAPPSPPPVPIDPSTLASVIVRITVQFAQRAERITSFPNGFWAYEGGFSPESKLMTVHPMTKFSLESLGSPVQMWAGREQTQILELWGTSFNGEREQIGFRAKRRSPNGMDLYYWNPVSFVVEVQDEGGNYGPYTPLPNPSDPPDNNNPPPPKKGIIVKEIRGGSEHEVKNIPRENKPDNAEFKCQSCEQNCVLMVRKKSDGTAKGICICKEGLSEEEEKMACEKCKAELLKELPEIVVTKVKAELLTGFKKETKEEIKPELTQEIKGSFDGEFKERIPETLPESEYAESPNAASSNLVGNVKSALLKDETFLDAIWTAVAAEFAKPETQEELFQSFTGEMIADRIIEISEAEKLKALGAKLIDAIVAVTDDAKLKTLKDKLAAPNTNNDPNKLTANGFEWTIAKVADKVETVSYVAKDGDSVGILSNSGSAIVTALKAKFAGKNFTIESINTNPTTKTYTYNINEL